MMVNICREGATARASLDAIQMEIIATRASFGELDRQPWTEAEVRVALLAVIKSVMYRNTPENFIESYTSGALAGHNLEMTGPLSLSAFVAHQAYLLGEDEVVDRYIARLKSAGKLGKVSAAERVARLGKLRTRLRELEIAEERAVLELERLGHVILRRADADPDVLLEVWGDAIEKEAA